MSNEVINSVLLPEGFAILRSLIEDFSTTEHEIITTLDPKLKPFQNHIPADSIFEIREGAFEETFCNIVNESDAVLLIAPESNNILFDLAMIVEQAGKELLGPSSKCIKITTDKTETQKKALDAHVLVPSGIRVAFSEKPKLVDKICNQIGYPVVFKPIDGVGGNGICIVASPQDIQAGMATVQTATKMATFQVQKFINGLDVSVSAIVSNDKAIPLSLNAQLIRLTPPNQESEYRGGYLPIKHSLMDETFENSRKILEFLEGSHGYMGLDYVFSYAPFLIEINPRITTSYLGLREVISQNPAQLILDAHQGRLPKKISLTGASVFSKVEFDRELRNITIPSEFQGYIKISTPPFPSKGRTTTFIVAVEKSIQSAQQTLTTFISHVNSLKN